MYKTLEEANNARLDLIERIQSIEAQLAERAAMLAGRRVPDEEYREYKQWKARAVRAKATMVGKLARTKSYIWQQRKDGQQNTAHGKE